jgi:DNA-binding transcriptional MerR regulator
MSHYKISEAVDILRKTYPDVSASALRYWDKLGIVGPSGKTKGNHRQYSEDDLDLLRAVKEMSLANYSIETIKKEIESFRSPNQAEVAKRQITILKELRVLANKMSELETINNEVNFQYVYRRDMFQKLFSGIPPEFIDKAIQYQLIHPKEIDGAQFFNKFDEKIIRIFAEAGWNLIERCKHLNSSVKFLKENVQISIFYLLTSAVRMLGAAVNNINKIENYEESRKSLYVGFVFLHEFIYLSFLQRE